MLFACLLGPALASALLALVVRPYRAVVGMANAALALVAVGAALGLWGEVLHGRVPVAGPDDLLRADALSTLLAFCVSVVGALAAWLGPGLGDDGWDRAQARRFRIFANLFTATMLFAVTTDNVGFMWVAIEATTITSALLIPLHASKASVEASWKYVLIGSVGIALAFAGTVLAYFDFATLVGRETSALSWTLLREVAPALNPRVLELAFVFILIGYGTKAGLAPMHTWLPDAHSEAPPALSAMMSGVLLAVALYAIVRWQAVVRAALGHGFADDVVGLLGVLSLAVGSLSLVAQRNYKRLLAYSSIEHTGLICIGLALGPFGVFASMLHLLNHSVAKSMMFLLAGRVLHRYRTAEIEGVGGLLRVMPWTGGFFAAGMLALLGLPPFGMFVSEFALVRAGFAAGRPLTMALVLALLAVGFVGVLGHMNRMLYGPPPGGVLVGEGGRRWAFLPLGACLAALVVLGLTVPPAVERLLAGIASIVAP
ncbi:MAG TPA: proton-conducting transporter membrane subunit [Methylomirabilota bacterium]|nr:proton-conducting transporter membrane subunit [Methylomirabilota bacterium]